MEINEKLMKSIISFILANEIWEYTIKGYFGFAYVFANYIDKNTCYLFKYDQKSGEIIRTEVTH